MTEQPINERVRALEVKEKELRQDVAEIKSQVTNHIPTEIAAVKKVVYELRDTHIAETAVANAWTNNVKKTLIVGGIIFTLLRIVEVLVK